MIYLQEVEKVYPSLAGPRVILKKTSMAIPTNRAVALLGANGAGKSTLLRMLAGVEAPDRGQIIRRANISWPIGFGGAIHPLMTGRQNIAFVARLYSLDPLQTVAFVEEFAELGAYLDMPVETYSSGMRSRLNFGLSFAVDFDCYLVDEATSTGDKRFRQKSYEAFKARRDRAGILFISHNPRTVRQYCEMGMVLSNGNLIPFADLEDAIRYYENVVLR
jgi:capsular polysaccharide transport system ATP-binding protein